MFYLDRKYFEPVKSTLQLKKPIDMSKSPNRQSSAYKSNSGVQQSASIEKNSFKKLKINTKADLKKIINLNALKSSRTINLYQSNSNLNISKKIKK